MIGGRLVKSNFPREVWFEHFGAVGNGVTDDSPAMARALAYLDAAGGGTLRFRAKTYRLDSPVVPVVDASPVPRQKPLRFVGAGGHWSGQGSPLNGGTVLDLRAVAVGGKVKLRGLGVFASEGITYTNLGAADTSPLMLTTNTTLLLRRNAFLGHATKQGLACDQDAIILGGTVQVHDGSDDAAFQGYGTVIEGNFFNNIRRQVYGRLYCNGVTVRNNTSWTYCGSNLAGGAAIEFDGDPSGLYPGNLCVGNTVADNLVEVNFYPYGVKLTKASQNNILGNKGYDGTATSLAMVRLEATAQNNLIVTSVGPAGVDYVSDAAGAAGGNRVISVSDDETVLKALILRGLLEGVGATFRPTAVGAMKVEPVGAMAGGALWQLYSGTLDANPDAAAIRFQWNADGSKVIGGNGAGNVTNNLATGAGYWNAGRAWGFNGTAGGAMEINTGTGGSPLNIKAFSIPLYDNGGTLRAILKPTAQGVEADADFTFNAVGKGLRIKEGANAKLGVAVLVAGSVVVANTAVTANTRIMLTRQAGGGALGHLSVTRIAATSFTITSSSGTDTSTVAWELIEPSP